MWKPALFLITIVMVTPGGRAAVSEYADSAFSQFVFNSPYAELALISLVLVAVGVVLLLLCQSPKVPDSTWVWREIREETGAVRRAPLRKVSAGKSV